MVVIPSLVSRLHFLSGREGGGHGPAGFRKVSLAVCVGRVGAEAGSSSEQERPELRPGMEAECGGRAGSTPTKSMLCKTDARAEQNPQPLHPQGLTQTLDGGEGATVSGQPSLSAKPQAATRKPHTWQGHLHPFTPGTYSHFPNAKT